VFSHASRTRGCTHARRDRTTSIAQTLEIKPFPGGAPTKSEVLTQISKDTGLSRKQVGGVFDSLSGVIKKSLRSSGLFTVPGLMKLKVVKKPATKAREGVNPFTGEKMTFKAKPASKKVRVLPLKNLKAMVNS
jgi:DNA-binding protein HU-beta